MIKKCFQVKSMRWGMFCKKNPNNFISLNILIQQFKFGWCTLQTNNWRSFWLMHCWAGTFVHTLPPQCVNEWESAWANVAQNGMCQHFHRQSLSCPWNALWGLLGLKHTKIQSEWVSAWQWWIAAGRLTFRAHTVVMLLGHLRGAVHIGRRGVMRWNLQTETK